ncbi:MAG: hypothetical protein Ct9H90mP16_05370 [Candidatus Poseidoniales archaeon]|nr:MAG: hypothetical protein Ct9H90mP16_05370 [Candidatus Poseidoniales archaeon]
MLRALEGPLGTATRSRCGTGLGQQPTLALRPPNFPLDEAFSIMDQFIAEIVKGIVETITLPSLINLDFADVRTIMKGGGVTMMLYGESDRGPEEVVHESLNHPLLDIDIEGPQVPIPRHRWTLHDPRTSQSSGRFDDRKIESRCQRDFRARQDPGFGDTIKVMAIITGVANERLTDSVMEPDKLAEAIGIARQSGARGPGFGSIQRFD